MCINAPSWHATAMLPKGVQELVDRYLRQIDLAIPGATQGFYGVAA
jgi:hypothetical protein